MIELFTFKRINVIQDLKSFDCEDPDLNDFFQNESINYTDQLLAVTYVFEDTTEVAGFFTVLNDRISQSDADKTTFNRLSRPIPNEKRYNDFPAVKVGRLGVNTRYKRKRVGSEMLDFIKGFFTNNNKTGCRFITVDAYNEPEILGFYRKNSFDFLTVKDEKDDTRLMYFDLRSFKR